VILGEDERGGTQGTKFSQRKVGEYDCPIQTEWENVGKYFTKGVPWSLKKNVGPRHAG